MFVHTVRCVIFLWQGNNQYIWCPKLNSGVCLDTVLQKLWNLDCPRKTDTKWTLTHVVLYLLAHQIVYYWNVVCYACVHVFLYACIHLLHWPPHTKTIFEARIKRQAIYVQWNNEVHSCNHCCSGKAINITYSECVL